MPGTQKQRNTRSNGSKTNGVNKDVIGIIEKNLKKDRALLEKLAKI